MDEINDTDATAESSQPSPSDSLKPQIPKGYRLWASGIPWVESRPLKESERRTIKEYSSRWLVGAVLLAIVGIASLIFYNSLGWWSFLIFGVSILKARDWIDRSKAFKRDLEAGYVHIFQGVGDPLLQTQRGKLSLWMRFLREGWSRPLVDSGYFITAKWEEFELLPESGALWSMENVKVPLGTYSPTVMVAAQGEDFEEEVVCRLPGAQQKEEQEVGRRRINDTIRKEISQRARIKMGKRRLTPAEKQELNQHIQGVRKLHKDLRLALTLVTIFFVSISIIGMAGFIYQFGWDLFKEYVSMQIGLGIWVLLLVFLLAVPTWIDKTFTQPILQSLKYLEADLKRGEVEFVHLPEEAEKTRSPLHEVLLESGIDWVQDGHPSPWRLVGYVDLELERIVEEGQNINVAEKTLAQTADTIAHDAQDAGAGYLIVHPRAGTDLMELYYANDHLWGQDLLFPLVSVPLNTILEHVHRESRVVAGFMVGTLKRELSLDFIQQLSEILEAKPLHLGNSITLKLPVSKDKEVSDKFAYYTAQPTKKLKGLIEVQEVKD